jgi:tRNA pseudouridine38-40 synthase
LGRHFVWHYGYGRLDVEAMQRAAEPLLGRHDFRSFQSSGAERKTTVRTIFELLIERGNDLPAPAGTDRRLAGRGAGGEGRSESVRFEAECAGQGRAGDGTLLRIEIEADGFLYNMVRAIVGTLVQVGCGSKPETWPGEVLLAADRRTAGPTAPPQGLCLIRVDY